MTRTERELLGLAGIIDSIVGGSDLTGLDLSNMPGELVDALCRVMKHSRLFYQAEYIGETGQCFIVNDVDYDLNSAGIDAAARSLGWGGGQDTDEERDPLNGELISATVPGYRQLSVRCACGHSKAAHSQGGCIGLMDNVHDICPCESFLGKT